MTGIGYGKDQSQWEHYWPADVHVIGKDIVRFHAIYWIGMLLSSNLPLPKTIFVHGHITSGGQKMSKSIGNVIDPYEVIARYGTDFTRFYLLYEIPTLDDGDFTYSRADELYTAEFANGLGNLLSRIASLCAKSSATFPIARDYHISPDVSSLLSTLELREALRTVWMFMWQINKKLSDDEPWKLSPEQLSTYLVPRVEEIRQLAMDLTPFVPNLAGKIADHFAKEEITKIEPLFPKLSA
jgi:methionyl-tRNA synthetase